MTVFWIIARIWLSVEYCFPGKNSSFPTTIGAMALLWNMARIRLYAVMASCRSVSVDSQFMLITGGSVVSADLMVTLPREVVAVTLAMMVAY